MGFDKGGKIASSEKQQGRSCGVAMWMVAAVVFLFTAPEAVVSSSSSTPTKCYSCMNCTSSDDDIQNTALLVLLGELSDGDNANISYMKDFDSFDDFEDRVQGSSTAASCPDADNMGEGSDLAVSGTNCMTMYFTIRDASTPTTFLSCTILTGVEKFFEDVGNMTEDQLRAQINALTQDSVDLDMKAVDALGDYELTGNLSICEDGDDCNFYPTGDEVKITEDLGAWSDDYDNETSQASIDAQAFADGVCDAFKEGAGQKSKPSGCASDVLRSDNPDLNKRRRRRSTVQAVIVFSLTFPPATGLDDGAFEAMYTAAVTTASSDPAISTYVSARGLGTGTASVTVGGSNPATTTQPPSSAPSLKPFNTLLASTLLVFGILASKRC